LLTLTFLLIDAVFDIEVVIMLLLMFEHCCQRRCCNWIFGINTVMLLLAVKIAHGWPKKNEHLPFWMG
jgi:uncharacterized membrane protein